MKPAVVLESCSCHKISFLPFSTNLSFGMGKSKRVLDLGSMVGARQHSCQYRSKMPANIKQKGYDHHDGKTYFKYTTSLVTLSTHLHLYVVECLQRQGRPICSLRVLLIEGCLKHSAYLTHVTPYLNFENQSSTSVQLIISSLKVRFNNLTVSLPVLPNFKQNLMHMCCVLSLSFFEEGVIAEAITYTSHA
jgi:hypothetical protein